MDAHTETRFDEIERQNGRLKKWLAVVTAWLVITWLWPLAAPSTSLPTNDPPHAVNVVSERDAAFARLPAHIRQKALAYEARLKAAKAETTLTTPDIGERYYTKEPLPKDYLLNQKQWRPDAFAECHRVFMQEMEKFPEWALLDVRNPFETYTARGPAVVIGLVFKTKKYPSEKWIVWDQTWLFRGGKLVGDFDTAEFGRPAVSWCFFQEEIQHIYGPASTTVYQEESPAERKARFTKSLDETDEQMREIFRRQKANEVEGLKILGIEPPAAPAPDLPAKNKLDPKIEATIRLLENEIEKLRRAGAVDTAPRSDEPASDRAEEPPE